MFRRKYPILEFDNERKAFIDPNLVLEKYGVHDFPDKMIICYFKEIIESLLANNIIKQYLIIQGENPTIFYRFLDEEIVLVPGIVGSPACAAQLEEGIALGAKKVMFCGGAGSLDKDITLGKIIVVDSAIRDEGTSYHYMRPSREVKADLVVVKTLSDFLTAQSVDYVIGKTWTTDAFYRETCNKINSRKKQGAIIVEMEQAACLAVSHFRKVKYGALIYSGDDLSGEKWDTRRWRNRVDVRQALVDYCRELVKRI